MLLLRALAGCALAAARDGASQTPAALAHPSLPGLDAALGSGTAPRERPRGRELSVTDFGGSAAPEDGEASSASIRHDDAIPGRIGMAVLSCGRCETRRHPTTDVMVRARLRRASPQGLRGAADSRAGSRALGLWYQAGPPDSIGRTPAGERRGTPRSGSAAADRPPISDPTFEARPGPTTPRPRARATGPQSDHATESARPPASRQGEAALGPLRRPALEPPASGRRMPARLRPRPRARSSRRAAGASLRRS